ncbi:MAG: flagellar hook-length control protein FliK [Lachnospiraceae bacterium]|nr:flagellar hook-length control protein FliK [Lachnospiraceae bacterium]
MGITPIMDASVIPDQLVTCVTPVNAARGEGADFRSVWNDQAGAKAAQSNDTDIARSYSRDNGSERKADVSKAPAAEKTENASKTDVKGKESPEKAVSEPKDDDKMLKDEEIVSATEALSTIVSELGQKIAEILNVSPEEFQGLLEANGITESDLPDKDIMSSFLVNALGAESKLDLLTDEAGCEIFKAGMEILTEVLASDSPVGEMTVSDLVDAVNKALPEGNQNLQAIVPEAKTEDPKAESVDRFVRNSNGDFELVSVSDTGSVTGEAKVVMQSQETSKDGKGSENNSEEHAAGTHGQFQIQTHGPADIEAPAPETPISYTENVNEIADQILDNMKTVTNGDFSDVEMQLHPASLGTLHIHVTNNAGVITASFVTENEAVKAAVESQMVRLAEQFEEQGIKVEAVEVTVASHSFEGNLDQSAGQPEGGNESGRSHSRTRRIDLSGMDDELDTSDMDDEERIAAEMMAANGNKVDYTA